MSKKIKVKCPNCGGRGSVSLEQFCEDCNGSGYIVAEVYEEKD